MLKNMFNGDNTNFIGCGCTDKFLMEKLRSLKHGEVALVFIPNADDPKTMTIVKADYDKVVHAVNIMD